MSFKRTIATFNPSMFHKTLQQILVISAAWSLVVTPAQAGGGAQQISQYAGAVAMGAMAFDSLQSGMHSGRCSPYNSYDCVMAVVFAVGAVSMAMGAADAGSTRSNAAFDPSGFDFDPSGMIPGLDERGLQDMLAGGGADFSGIRNGQIRDALSKVSGSLKNVKGKGFSYDPDSKTISTPNGKVPMDAIGDKDAMVAAGLTPQQAGQIMSALDKAKQAHAQKAAALAKKMGVGGKGGGGAGSGLGKDGYWNKQNRGPASLAGDMPGFNMNDYLKKKNKRKPAGVAGMAKRYGNDKIGVAADSIFEMIHRRYQIKYKNNDFLKENPQKPRSPRSSGF